MKTIFSLLIFFCLAALQAQVVPFSFNNQFPINVENGINGEVWLVETGTGANDGAVSRLRSDGTKETVVQGLPSYFDTTTQELQGATSVLRLADDRLLVLVGAGVDSLSKSILEFNMMDYLNKAAALELSDRRSDIRVGEYAASKGFAESNPYSLILNSDGDFVIADAAANAAFKYDLSADTFATLAVFPVGVNPLPFGPPVYETVPTKIISNPAGGYWITCLTGFPFLDGAAVVYSLSEQGQLDTLASGLTLVTDMEYDAQNNTLLTLQFGKFGMVDSVTPGFLPNSAQLVEVDMQGNLDTLLGDFGPVSGMALLPTGNVLFTHPFAGIVFVWDPSLVALEPVVGVQQLEMFPNPASGHVVFRFRVDQPAEAGLQLLNSAGKRL
ncbi:MAG: ScyD/ScyE family protein [Bacteroidia bacterium]